MTPQEQEELEGILRHLAARVEAVVESCVADGLLKPEKKPYRRHVGEGFEYDENGARFRSGSWERITKESWDTAYAHVVLTAQESAVYAHTLEALAECSEAGKAVSNRLGRIVRQLVLAALTEREAYEARVRELLAVVAKESRGEPVKHRAELGLDGGGGPVSKRHRSSSSGASSRKKTGALCVDQEE